MRPAVRPVHWRHFHRLDLGTALLVLVAAPPPACVVGGKAEAIGLLADEVDFVDAGAGKPIGIQRFIGNDVRPSDHRLQSCCGRCH